jgi:redox-regulated HSP33 family molecular chaperone
MQMVLSTLPEDDIAYLVGEDGKIAVTCEFCNETQGFDPADLTLPRA